MVYGGGIWFYSYWKWLHKHLIDTCWNKLGIQLYQNVFKDRSSTFIASEWHSHLIFTYEYIHTVKTQCPHFAIHTFTCIVYTFYILILFLILVPYHLQWNRFPINVHLIQEKSYWIVFINIDIYVFTHPSSDPEHSIPSLSGDQRTWNTLAKCPVKTFRGWSELVAR